MNERNPSLSIIIDALLELKNNNVSKDDKNSFLECEKYRNKLLHSNQLISYSILGLESQLKVKTICKRATSSAIWAQFLFLITKKMEAPYFLEIGTNLGVSGSYITHALRTKKNSYFVTMEGVPELCTIASSQFSKILDFKKFKVYNGLYSDTLPILMREEIRFNIIFIDGNHKKNPTLQYFRVLKEKLNYPAIVIFDDINWSSDMKVLWEIVKKDQQVLYSIDLFKFGILILSETVVAKQGDYKLHLAY